jgi:hypothetical protein
MDDWIAVREMVSLSIIKPQQRHQVVRKRMPTISRQTKNTVPVGETPVPKYSSWYEHREAMRRDAEDRRMSMERRRVKAVINRRSLE